MAAVLLPGSWQLSLATLLCVVLLSLPVGMPPIIAIMESVYVMSEREIWKQIARFWGQLFGILLNLCVVGAVLLAIAYVATGGTVTREAVAVIGTTVVMLGVQLLLFRRYFGEWWQQGRLQHLIATLFLMLPSVIAILVIAMTGSWTFDSAGGNAQGNLSMRLTDLSTMLFDPSAQLAFVHLISACYLSGTALVLAIGAWYLLRRRNVQIARRSMTVAASFGLASALSLAVRGGTLGGAFFGHAGAAQLWSLRSMMTVGVYLIALFAVAFFLASKRKLHHDVFLRVVVGSLPLPWIAIALGWLASQKRWWLGDALAVMTTQAKLAALLFLLIILTLKAFVIIRVWRAVHGGPEQMKLWPADAGTNAKF